MEKVMNSYETLFVVDASLSEINEVADVILANVRTNISQKSILSYAAQAVSGGWAKFEISEITMPTPDTRYGYSSRSTAWIWVVDYPLAAQQLQKLLYGKTNIALDPNRVNVLNNYLTQKPSYTGPSYSSQIGYTGDYTYETTVSGWTGESTTEDPLLTTGSETTTNWWQGIIGGETTTAETPVVTDPPVTETPTAEPPTEPVANDPTYYSEE